MPCWSISTRKFLHENTSFCLPYGLNGRTKCMNKDSPIRELFLEQFIDTRRQSKITNHDLSSGIEILFNSLKQFCLKYRKNECRKLF